MASISSTSAVVPHRGLARLIAVDVRNLAILRIGLAIIVLVDLAQRVGSVALFCSDQGIVDRELNHWLCPSSEGFWSLYWLDGSTGFATMLLAINAVAAVFLLLGWQTRLATAVCLVLAYSLQMRMPLILTAGHVLLRMLLFWSLFLPLGAAWSLDAGRKRDGKAKTYAQVISIATAAIMLQVAMMYLFSGFAKWNDVWLRGEAMSLAMQLDMYVRPLGRELLQRPELLMLLTFLTLLLECIGPLLLWMPYANAQWRTALAVMFWMLHIGIWLTMSIGIFSAVAMLAWVVFLPSEFWRFFESDRAKKIAQAATQPNILRLGLFPSIVCGLFVVYIVALNVANINPVKSKVWFGTPLRKFGNATMTLQQFKMFDRPAKDNLWWRLVYKDSNDSRHDAFPPVPQLLANDSQRPGPDEIYFSMPNQFWRRLLFNIATLEEQVSADRQQINRLKQRTGEALWNLRNEERQYNARGSVDFTCGSQPISLSDWAAPVQIETWATIETARPQ